MLVKGLSLAAVVAFLAFLRRDTFDPGSLAGAKVLLTGASAGIGEEMAYHYSRFGAEIVLTARREAVLQKVMEKCFKLGARKVFYIPADMALPSDPEIVLKFALQKLGGLDYLVLNHIGGSPFEMWAGDADHTRWLMQVNFLSYVQLASAALPVLAETAGSIVVVSSIAGKISTPYTTSYSATKFALDGFFGSLRQELSMRGTDISITLCILGLIDTDSAMEKTRCMLRKLPRDAEARLQEVLSLWCTISAADGHTACIHCLRNMHPVASCQLCAHTQPKVPWREVPAGCQGRQRGNPW